MALEEQLDETPSKRTQLNRRDSDEQVERAVQNRLGHLPPSLWETKQNAAGDMIRDLVKKAIKKNSCVNKRLSSRF